MKFTLVIFCLILQSCAAMYGPDNRKFSDTWAGQESIRQGATEWDYQKVIKENNIALEKVKAKIKERRYK